MTYLRQLYINNNQISDITPLQGLINLNILNLGYNQITNMASLQNMTSLDYLFLKENQLNDISPLTNLTGLYWLELQNNQISNITPLQSLTNLEVLYLNDNQISDITSLVLNNGLGAGDTMFLERNYLDTLAGSQDMNNINTLISRGGTVYYIPQKDTTPPITMLSTNPASPDGNNWFKTTPSITLTRNEPGTTYYAWEFEVNPTTYTSSFSVPEGSHTLSYWSKDTANNEEIIKTQAIKIDTGLPVDPTVISSSHTLNVWSNNNNVTITLSGATDAVSGVDGFAYAWAQLPVFPVDPIKSLEETVTSVLGTTLAPGDMYFHLRTKDNAGNWSPTIHIGPYKLDPSAPTAPTLSGSAASSTEINLSWTASTDAVSGVAGYKIYNGDTDALLTTTASTSYSFNSLTQNTTYTYYVKAYDMADNLSSLSNTVSITTPSTTDTTSPSAPTNLNAVPMSSSQIDLSWNASTDNVGVTGYKIYNADTSAEVATITGTSYSHTGLSPGTTHNYYVKAFDAAGNISSSSNTASATTFAGGTNNTQTGTNTEVNLGNGVSLTFDNVAAAGTTSTTVSNTPPGGPPSGFRFRGYYYDVTTTATYSGFIIVRLPYNEADISGNEANLKLFHWNGSNWEDVTVSVDTVNNIITGKVTSLSPFGVGEPALSPVPATGYNTYWLLIVGISLMVSGGYLLLKGKRRLV